MLIVEMTRKDPQLCIDYQKLNTVTKDEIFLIPNIEERVEVSATSYISTRILEGAPFRKSSVLRCICYTV